MNISRKTNFHKGKDQKWISWLKINFWQMKIGDFLKHMQLMNEITRGKLPYFPLNREISKRFTT